MGICESKGSLIDIVSSRIGCRETSALSLSHMQRDKSQTMHCFSCIFGLDDDLGEKQ